MMNNSKGGATVGTYLILFGIIFAVTIGVIFARKVAPLLRLEDKSVKSFDELADKIEEISNSPSQRSAEAVMINLGKDELILFFDNNTRTFAKISNIRGLEKNFSFFNQDVTLEKIFRDKAPYTILFPLFEKPSRCGNSSCMVLCRSFDLFMPRDRLKYLSQKAPYIKTSQNFEYVVTCNIAGIRTFSNIEHFYRKPFYYEREYDETRIPMMSGSYPPALRGKPSYFHVKGLSLFANSDIFESFSYNDIQDLKRGEPKKGGLVVVKRPAIGEIIENGGVKFSYLIQSHYIYIQSHGKDVVLCYEPPCTTFEERLYLAYQKYLDSCLDSNDCGSLFSAIDGYTKYTKALTFSTKNNKLYIKHDDYNFPFDKDIELYVKRTDEENKDFPASRVSIEKVYIYMFGIELLVLEANNARYALIDISSLSDDKITKPRLIFKVKGEELEE